MPAFVGGARRGQRERGIDIKKNRDV